VRAVLGRMRGRWRAPTPELPRADGLGCALLSHNPRGSFQLIAPLMRAVSDGGFRLGTLILDTQLSAGVLTLHQSGVPASAEACPDRRLTPVEKFGEGLHQVMRAAQRRTVLW
jgi:hypothetical protein